MRMLSLSGSETSGSGNCSGNVTRTCQRRYSAKILVSVTLPCVDVTGRTYWCFTVCICWCEFVCACVRACEFSKGVVPHFIDQAQ